MRHPFRLRDLAAVAAVVATLALGATRGRADVLPRELRDKPCTAPGQSCKYAGPEEDEAGTCATATCTKQLPARDGGTALVKFDCFRCTAAGPSSATPPPKSRSSGCAVAPERCDTGSLAVTGALIGGLLLFARRVRRR